MARAPGVPVEENKSVEPTFAYLVGGCGGRDRDKLLIILHTRLDME